MRTWNLGSIAFGWLRLPGFELRLPSSALEKAMATHSSTLAGKIPWMEEPGRLQSMGSQRVRQDWATSLSLFTFQFHALEKEIAVHSSVLAWRIPGTGEPGGLPSMGSHRVRYDWSDLAAAAKNWHVYWSRMYYYFILGCEISGAMPTHSTCSGTSFVNVNYSSSLNALQ